MPEWIKRMKNNFWVPLKRKHYFDKNAELYRKYKDDLAANGYKGFGIRSDVWNEDEVKKMLESIKQALKLSGGEYVLEIGCGSGMIARYVSQFCRQYIGIDLSGEMVRVAASKNINNARFIQMNGKQLLFSSNEFHRVFSYFVFNLVFI